MSQAGKGRPAGPPTGRILERAGELSRIHGALEQAVAQQGTLLVLEGPGGIGKSRLLEEAAALARLADMEAMQARGAELERGYAFGVVIRLLESRFAQMPAAARRRLFRGRASLAAPLLSPTEKDAPHVATTDEFTLIHGLYWCVVNLSEHHPVALLIDDVHWADDLSLRFLLYLAGRLEDLPVVLIVAIRTGDPTAESELVARLATAGSQPPLRPAQLSRSAVRELLAATGNDAASREDFVQASWRVTGGNPFLVRELMTAMRLDPEAWSDPEPASLDAFAPESVGRSVTLRLERLGRDAIQFARACAVLGDGTPAGLVARLADLEPAVAIDTAERLTAAQILARIDPVSFAHPMIRSAVYGGLGVGERSRLHAAAAKLLHAEDMGAERVADHLLASAQIGEAWARDALHQAARAAGRKGAPRTAVRYLRRALEHSPPTARSASMLIDLGILEAAAGETTSLTRFDEALATIDEPAEQARALYALGWTQYRYGKEAQAAKTFRRGADIFQPRDHDVWVAFEAASIFAANVVPSLRRSAIGRLESVAAGVPGSGPRTSGERGLLALLAAHRSVTTPPAGHHAELARRALAEPSVLREEISQDMTAGLPIFALWWCGYPDEAQRAVDHVLADVRERGDILAFAEASSLRAMIMYARGRIREAMADAQAAVEGVERGWHTGAPLPYALLANCLIERGRLDLAETVLRDAQPRPASGVTLQNAWLHWARGRLLLARAQARTALEELLLVRDIVESYGFVNFVAVPWRGLAALAANAADDLEQARELVGSELAVARAFGIPAQIGAALRARGLVEGGPAGAATLADAVSVLEDADAPLDLAHALVDLGGAYRRAGRRQDSLEPLRRGLDLAHHCGAVALEQHARDELRASGLRPRRAAISGIDALTPSEWRIAQLAAQGHTNRSIAETLFVTKNTVEWHLRHIYRKLDVRSRDALAATLADRPPAASSG